MRLQTGTGALEWDGSGALRIEYAEALAGLGPRVLPIEALRAVEVSAIELTLELREHADPLLSVSGGSLASIYRFEVAGAERLASELRIARARRGVPETAAPAWLVATPPAADALQGKDATVAVASGQLMFAYPRSASRRKKTEGNPRSVPLTDITAVSWEPGLFRIDTARTPLERPKPRHDPAALRVPARGFDALFFAARLLTRIQP
ncbi:DUF4429 domain-containing protein [Kribbella sandramycini]|uniref:DUF4429 domain-containing protein n=1 Tax=Kribbella sandramycini TaxID=60450 RepID=A0A7Y4P270_9ACTN|nr:hypothetical protein [Kribbella sandramycini]NOL44496.1 DUF4429 domain-containing protein [Kribbella sandramycini]